MEESLEYVGVASLHFERDLLAYTSARKNVRFPYGRRAIALARSVPD